MGIEIAIIFFSVVCLKTINRKKSIFVKCQLKNLCLRIVPYIECLLNIFCYNSDYLGIRCGLHHFGINFGVPNNRDSIVNCFSLILHGSNVGDKRLNPAISILRFLTNFNQAIVHTARSIAAIVSSQYLEVCKEHQAKLDAGVEIGTQLDVSKDYLEEAARCVSEIGVKLAHVTWRKLLPNEIDKADHQLNAVSFELLHRGDYKLVCRLLDFACMKAVKHANEEIRRYLVLNRAQAYKWLQNQKQCLEILDAEDWSAVF